MVKGYLVGQMAGNMMESMFRIEGKVMDCLYGKMEGNMMDNGSIASSMVKDSTILKMDLLKLGFGRLAKESDGSNRMNLAFSDFGWL